MNDGPGPMARRRQLGIALRQRRLEFGTSVREVAEYLLCSPAKISRIETGQRPASLRDVRDLCQLYGLDSETSDQLMRLARLGREPAWWQRLDLEPSLQRFIGLEGSATEILEYQLGVIPGLLQTREYANAVLSAQIPDNASALEEAVDARIGRQEHLKSDTALRMIIDESVLRRTVGGADVMREQIGKLIKLGDQPNIELRVMPFDSGAHMGMVSGFTLLNFGSSTPFDSGATMPDVVFIEDAAKNIYLDRPDEVERYAQTFHTLQARALTTKDTTNFLTAAYQGV